MLLKLAAQAPGTNCTRVSDAEKISVLLLSKGLVLSMPFRSIHAISG